MLFWKAHTPHLNFPHLLQLQVLLLSIVHIQKGTHPPHLDFPHPSSPPRSSPLVHSTVTHIIVKPQHTLYWKAHTPFASVSHTLPQFHVLLPLFTSQWPTPLSRLNIQYSVYSKAHPPQVLISHTLRQLHVLLHLFTVQWHMSLSHLNTHCSEKHTHPTPPFPAPFLTSTFFSSCSHYSDPHHCHISTYSTVCTQRHTCPMSWFSTPFSARHSSPPDHSTITHVIVMPQPTLYWKAHTPHTSISHTLPQLDVFLLLFTLHGPTSSAHNMHWKAHTHTLCQHCQQDLFLTEICQFLKQTYCIFSKQNFVDTVPIKLLRTISVNISLPSPAEWRPTLSTYPPILLSAPWSGKEQLGFHIKWTQTSHRI